MELLRRRKRALRATYWLYVILNGVKNPLAFLRGESSFAAGAPQGDYGFLNLWVD